MSERSGNVTVTAHGDGIRALLASEDVRRDLRRRANRIAETANQGISDEGFVVDDNAGEGGRARAAVIASSFPARIAESRHRQLLRSIDAARD